ncbi:MAG: methyltransferase domain-containing protein [Actinomycetota bacterium]
MLDQLRRLAGRARDRIPTPPASVTSRLPGRGRGLPTSIAELDPETHVRLAYDYVLGRPADDAGLRNYLDHLAAGTRDRRAVVEEMQGSDEHWFGHALRYADAGIAIHRSRCLFVQQLPAARRILDIGGTHQQSPEGAMIHLGYPYAWERMVIVDLPPDERHPLYQQMRSDEPVQSRLGPVEYSFHSMADLSRFEDGSFDLVYSGQTFEHVPEDVGDEVLAEVRRVLSPGGWFALDTPNGAACRLQLAGTGETVTNPDHDIEYDHGPLRDKLVTAGFDVEQQVGLTHLPNTFAQGVFDPSEMHHTGMYADIERCYLLAYVCRR